MASWLCKDGGVFLEPRSKGAGASPPPNDSGGTCESDSSTPVIPQQPLSVSLLFEFLSESAPEDDRTASQSSALTLWNEAGDPVPDDPRRWAPEILSVLEFSGEGDHMNVDTRPPHYGLATVLNWAGDPQRPDFHHRLAIGMNVLCQLRAISSALRLELALGPLTNPYLAVPCGGLDSPSSTTITPMIEGPL